MKNKLFLFALSVVIFASSSIMAQKSVDTTNQERPRIYAGGENQIVEPTPTPTPRRVVVITSATPLPSPTPRKIYQQPTYNNPSNQSIQRRTLRYGEIRNRLAEAKRQMQAKPLRISLNDVTQTTDIVRLAFIDYRTNQLDYVVLPKTEFLSRNSQFLKRSEGGQTVRIQTKRGNGVNTPIIIFDTFNKAQQPLLVQYPIEKYGRFIEMAYYVSTHPGIVTPETVNAGKLYVRNVLDAARAKLRQKGIFIQPKVVDIAERLALVEHVDHYRFRTEFHPKIYNDVYTLYALNQGQTYRYSVSRAGAGGMIQMIPSTYRMIRSRYYSVGLIPDFVRGMRNHLNAAQAMLLYMQMTWNDLIGNSTVYNAMQSGIATQEQLMAAGYNSNPARLPRYIRRGGAGWTRLIPSETKVYLRIYASVERYVPLRPRTK